MKLTFFKSANICCKIYLTFLSKVLEKEQSGSVCFWFSDSEKNPGNIIKNSWLIREQHPGVSRRAIFDLKHFSFYIIHSLTSLHNISMLFSFNLNSWDSETYSYLWNRALRGNGWVLPYRNRALGLMVGFCLIETEH